MSKTVVITGAGGVLCSAFAAHMASLGHKVAVLDLNIEAAEKVAADIVANGGVAKAYKTNVLDKDCIQEVHDAIVKDLGLCDILINALCLGCVYLQQSGGVGCRLVARCR